MCREAIRLFMQHAALPSGTSLAEMNWKHPKAITASPVSTTLRSMLSEKPTLRLIETLPEQNKTNELQRLNQIVYCKQGNSSTLSFWLCRMHPITHQLLKIALAKITAV